MPRLSTVPIKLKFLSYELNYINVTRETHDGFYNCSIGLNVQTFDVVITIPPIFMQTFNALVTSNAATVSINCSVTGNPQPEITWYKNGILLENTLIRRWNYPTLKIHTMDPDDEGIYQCFAKNIAGEISNDGRITLRPHKNLEKLEDVKCYPINYTTLSIWFNYTTNPGTKKFNIINFYFARDRPYSWASAFKDDVMNTSIEINQSLSPLKPYTLFLRGGITADLSSFVHLTKLSNGIKCATQGCKFFLFFIFFFHFVVLYEFVLVV